MKLSAHVATYRQWAESYLATKGFTLDNVKTGVDAWNVAHRAGITSHAYALSRDVLDSHIKTACGKMDSSAV